MQIPFITSRKGHINQISIHRYELTDEYKNNSERRYRFLNWLDKNPDVHVYDVEENIFILFEQLPEISNTQYKHIKSTFIEAPFANTSKISSYLGSLIRNSLSKNYARFLNQNVFEIESKCFSPFKLIKGVEFNLELFPSGEFYIHFLPVSKIVSDSEATIEYIKRIKAQALAENKIDLEINLVSLDRYKSFKHKFSDSEKWYALEKKVVYNKHIATFDYHFLSVFSPEVFGSINRDTVKMLAQSIIFLTPVASKIDLPNWIQLASKPFSRVQTIDFSTYSNLLIGGGGFSCREQKAAYYNGVFQPVNNKTIIPVFTKNVSDDYLNSFHELFNAFNKNGSEINFIERLNLEIDSSDFIEGLRELKRKYGRNALVIIFTKNSLPINSLKPIQNLHLQIQTYLGENDKHQMSNFVVKCIEKLGGKLSVIKDTHEPDTTYFIGVDLGHSTNKKEEFSNLGMVLFNNRGIVQTSYVNKRIPRNEALTEEVIRAPLDFFLNHLQKNDLPLPHKIIIHRDGKLHKTDLEIILQKIAELFDIYDIDIVEIIKSGYPIFAKFDDEKSVYLNPTSGECWLLKEQRYAILATNIQSDQKGAIINPIIIKHKYGKTDFFSIAYQVYWFTKIYTNNLYNSTRLPATTLKANNIVSTGDKNHISSNLG